MTIKWSPQQEAIFDWFRVGGGNLVVRARAGTGKTTTILHGLEFAPESSILLAAFNKKIATELQRKLKNPRAEAKTLHSVGYSIIRSNWRGVGVDDQRTWVLAEESCPAGTPDTIISLVSKLSDLGKQIMPLADSSEALIEIADDFDCVPATNKYTVEQIAEYAFNAMRLARRRAQVVSFQDMCYLPLVNEWVAGKYPLVVIDECQDMNPAQILLAQQVLAPNGRIAVVGDDRQGIYRFRGADSESLDRLKAEYNAVELPLTVTYRCPKKIVELAQTLVPDYQCADTAPDGLITDLAYDKLAVTAAPGDFVLSRVNAPLVKTCLSLLRNGTRATVEGRDIGKGLTALVRKLGNGGDVSQFLEKLHEWELIEVGRARNAKKDSKAVEIADRAETLRVLAEGIVTLTELQRVLDSLFSDDGTRENQVTCSTVHKAKGLEARRVFLLEGTLYPGGRKTLEEQNIHYVGITRAIEELSLVK